MAEIVNLNRVRKNKRIVDQKRTAERNRVKFGRSKADRQKESQEQDRRNKALDGNRLETED